MDLNFFIAEDFGEQYTKDVAGQLLRSTVTCLDGDGQALTTHVEVASRTQLCKTGI